MPFYIDIKYKLRGSSQVHIYDIIFVKKYFWTCLNYFQVGKTFPSDGHGCFMWK